MSDAVTIVIDDTVLWNQPGDINIGDTDGWFTTTTSLISDGFPSTYNDTNFLPEFTPFGHGAWVFEFEGTSVAFFGITPPTQFNQTFGIGNSALPDVNITNPRNYTAYKYLAASHGGQFYASAGLDNPEQFRIGFTGARGLALDYALVAVGQSTVLKGQTILVDDSSSEIIWNGNWTVKANYTLPVPCELPFGPRSDNDPGVAFTAKMTPHGNSSRFSSVVGDSFTFQFAGTAISVSGITPGDDQGPDWLLGMNFTLDGKTTAASFTREPDYITKPHFVYFSARSLKPGNHTLVAKITDVAGTQTPSAHIDYITYDPSFLTLHDKPNFSSSISGANASQIPGQPSSTPSSTAAPATGGTGGRHSHAGAIAGGVLGGCCLVFLIIFFIWKRAGQKKGKNEARLSLSTSFN
ncbi:hypothetical protein FB451DRAFT_1145721 [Mycena latifolia]|nr:hypothetical protein FB451DRAFT_1145721 [Mycena latifolia]